MKDRQPTQPGRVKLTPENGTNPFYAIMEMADEPTEIGTPPTKANLLQDETEFALFGNLADRTVNDAFVGVAAELRTIRLRLDSVSTMSVTLRSTQGNALPGVYIQGMFDENGNTCITNSAGVASGYVSEGSVAIGVTGYADIVDYTETFTATAGADYTKVLTVTTRNFLKVTTSKNVKFSGNVSRLDVTVVGGGGGAGGAGAKGNSSDEAATGGGGGGGAVVVQENVTFTSNTQYAASIGAGGAHGTSTVNSNGTAGSSGGTTTFMGLSATGGGGGGGATVGWVSASQGIKGGTAGVGVGGGNGGAGVWSRGVSGSGTQITNGNAGSNGKAGYSSFTETVLYGAGGGSGSTGESTNGIGGAGGTYGGGKGGNCTYNVSQLNGTAGTAGSGSGGGSSGYYVFYAGDQWTFGTSAKGGSGCVAIRMHLKFA